MYRDVTYQDPFSSLEVKELLALGRLCGRRNLQAKWAFLAILPEIAQRDAHRKVGFTSIFEYAARLGGVSREDVAHVVALHRRIGEYWVLWRLLAMGAVGMSKLQRIARWVTPENATWWAEQIVRCTRAQLDALISAMIDRDSAPVVAGRCEGESEAADEAADEATGEAADEAIREAARGWRSEGTVGAGGIVASQAGAARPEPVLGRGERLQIPEVEVPRELLSGAHVVPDKLVVTPSQSFIQDSARGTVPTIAGDRNFAALGETTKSEASAGSVYGASLSPVASEGAGHGVVAEAGGYPSDVPLVTVRLQMTPANAKALRDLLALVESADGPTSLGDLVGRLAFEALDRGSVPGRWRASLPVAAEADALTEPETRGNAGPQEQSQERSAVRPRVALPSRRMLQVAYRNLDTGAQWLPSQAGPISYASLSPSEQARMDAAPAVRFDELRSRALAAKVRHAQKVSALKRTGTEVAADSGRHIPAAISVYLMARSGGLCERQGCRGQVEHFHHCDPFSEHYTHDPDRMLAICQACHDGYHGGLVVPDKTDPRIWWPVKTSELVERSRVDEAYGDVKERRFAAG
jgi:hypothetical protein